MSTSWFKFSSAHRSPLTWGLATLAALLLCASAASAANLLTEKFSYPNGPLDGNDPGTGPWANHSGTLNQMQVTGGRAIVVQDVTTNASEDVHVPFPAQLATAKTYASFKLVVTDITSLSLANYFAHFKKVGNVADFRARVHVAQDSSGGVPIAGRYKIGLSASSTATNDSASIIYFPGGSYSVGERHVVVTSYNAANGESELWVDPVNELSTKVTRKRADAAGDAVAEYALRQGGSATHHLTEAVDELAVGTTFADAILNSELSMAGLCVTDSTKMCGTTVFTNQPWHILFSVANRGQKDINGWSFDIVVRNLVTGQLIPLKTQVPGQPIPANQGITINWPSPLIFASDQKGQWEVTVMLRLKDGNQTDPVPSDNTASTTFVVQNKATQISDLYVANVCATDSSKACETTVFTNQPWHVMFAVGNLGNKVVDNWSYDILLIQPMGGATIPLKTQVQGPPIPPGAALPPIVINWPSPYIFSSADKGPWQVVVRATVKDPTNPDANPNNNVGTAAFQVLNKTQTPVTDLAMLSVCATDTTKACTQLVYTNQPWHVLFTFENRGNKVADNWSFDILLNNPLTGQVIPLKTQVPGPAIVPGTYSFNWPSPYLFATDQKGTWNLTVRLSVKDPLNPDADPTNNTGTTTFVVQNKGTGPSDIALDFACVTDTSKQCLPFAYTNQPWHVLFNVRNVGQKPVDNWSFNIELIDSTNAQIFPIKTQVPGPPLPLGGSVTVNWPSPYIFATTQKGTWYARLSVVIKDPTNPDANPGNNFLPIPFQVVNKGGGEVSDLSVVSACVTEADSLKQCTSRIFTNQPWHVDFQVANQGNKVIDNWSFDILLLGATQNIPLKLQVPGPPIQPGQTLSLNWPSPYLFTSADKGPWQVQVRATVKDPTNPDPNPNDNFATVPFVVENKGGPVSDLAVQFACVTDTSKQCRPIVYTNQPWHVLFSVQNVGQKPIDNWSFDIFLDDSASGTTVPLKTQVPGPTLLPGQPFTINWPSPHVFTSDQKGQWILRLVAIVKDPTNPDANPSNNAAIVPFAVVNKTQQPVTDIAVAGVCAADTSKFCTNSVLTHAPWHILFNVRNLGQKPVDNWSFNIRLSKSDTTLVIPLKTQIPGPPLPLGGTATVNWASPYEFASADKGGWDIFVDVVVKEPDNPDTNLVNNHGSGHVVVDNPTATLLSLFQADPAGNGIELRWRFADAASIADVRVERSDLAAGPWTAIAPSRRDEGGVAVAMDRTVQIGRSYWYRLIVTTRQGERMTFGPLSGTAGEAVREFSVSRVSPNPTSGPTTIEFTLPREAPVRLTIVDVAGRQMATLADGVYRSGRYQATWTGRTERGVAPVGVYLVLYQVPGQNLVKRLVLTR